MSTDGMVVDVGDEQKELDECGGFESAEEQSQVKWNEIERNSRHFTVHFINFYLL
jgi:hypothetical protein